MTTDNPNETNLITNPHPSPTEDNDKLFGILCYIGPLVIVSFMMKKEEPFVKFHIKQGAVVFVIDIIAWFLASMFFGGFIFAGIVNIIAGILSIIGVVNVIQHKEQELPIVGKFSRRE